MLQIVYQLSSLARHDLTPYVGQTVWYAPLCEPQRLYQGVLVRDPEYDGEICIYAADVDANIYLGTVERVYADPGKTE